MGTIDKNTADKIIRDGDDTIRYIIRYENMFNGEFAYGTIGFRENYHESAACINPQLYWTHPKETRPFSDYLKLLGNSQ